MEDELVKTTYFQVRCDPDMLEDLRRVADDLERSMAWVLRQAFKEFRDRHDEEYYE